MEGAGGELFRMEGVGGGGVRDSSGLEMVGMYTL